MRQIHIIGSKNHGKTTAGAKPAAFVTADGIGVFLPRDADSCYRQLTALYAGCDLVHRTP